jgi:hypothetical protein
MPEPTEQRRFIFHGNAMPFGGRILKIGKDKVSDLIPGPPCAALTVLGGYVRATTRGSSYKDAFRWGRTLAEAKGERADDGSHITTVTSAVADLFIKNDPEVFEADLISNTLESVHPEKGQPSITAKEIIFGSPEKGLSLAGQRIELDFDDDLSKCPTFNDFSNAYRRDREFFDKHQKTLCRGKKGEARFGEPLPRTSSGYVVTSIVKSIRWRKRTIPGNRLYLKGFGALYFGELLMNENNRRLTMVRFAMGSAMQVEAAGGETDPNGTWTN